MKNKLSMKRYYLLILSACLFGQLQAQNSDNILRLVSTVADRFIHETSFEYELSEISDNSGISYFSMEGQNTKAAVYYGHAKVSSEKAEKGLLALSFKGYIKVFLNGKEIFSGNSNWTDLIEYTYDRFIFQNTLEVNWKEGENDLLVKTLSGKEDVEVLFFPLGENDLRSKSISFQTLSNHSPSVVWELCGPWKDEHSQSMSISFPPEEYIKESYISGDCLHTIKWLPATTRQIKKLVFTENATGESFADWNFANSTAISGLLSLSNAGGNEKYLDFAKKWADNIIENIPYFREQYHSSHATRCNFYRMFRMSTLDDTGGPAIPFAELESMENNGKYSNLLDEMLEYVLFGQSRLFDMTFCRQDPEPETILSEDLYLSIPFLLKMAKLKGNEMIYDDVALQIIKFNSILSKPGNGLFYQGWYNTRFEPAGVHWAPSNGWVLWAISEALSSMPVNHPQYEELRIIFRDHIKSLSEYQASSGMWHQLLDNPESPEETSGTAMIVLAMARGARMGWINKSYKKVALKGWKALEKNILEDGSLTNCATSPVIKADLSSYSLQEQDLNDPAAIGALLTAGSEIILLLND